jgi:hypothetical protein
MGSIKPTEELIELSESLGSERSQNSPHIGQMINEELINEFTARFLGPNEVLLGAFYGNHYSDGKNLRIGLPFSYLLATNQRLIRLARGSVLEDRTFLCYDEIANVELWMEYCEAGIVMRVKGKDMVFQSPFKDDVQKAWKLINKQLTATKSLG